MASSAPFSVRNVNDIDRLFCIAGSSESSGSSGPTISIARLFAYHVGRTVPIVAGASRGSRSVGSTTS